METNENKFYYPFCRNPGCDGVLKIKINRNNFSLDYECDKNKEHNGKNIYFKTFERFYLKEMIKDKCKRCSSFLENTIKYKCKSCENYYCSSCFIFHKHIKQNINNIKIISTKCNNHNANIMHYCIKCKKYLCNYCLKNKNTHQEHITKNLYNLMPSKQTINKIKNRIKEYDEIMNDIDIWLKEFEQKIKRLKQNLKDEKELFQKLILNFNQSFINYSYFTNFSYLNKYSKCFNNEYLDNFSKSSTFEDKGKLLFEYLIHEKNKLLKSEPEIEIYNNNILRNCNIINNSIIVKISDNYFFKYSEIERKVKIVKYKVKDNKIIEDIKAEKTFSSRIYDVSIFNNLDNTYTIYACLSNNKTITVFNFDSENCVLSNSEDKIYKPENGHFKKIIQLPHELVVTSDDDYYIDIWIKEQETGEKYSYLKDIKLKHDISDILFVNSEYFISSQNYDKKIYFYDIKSLSIEKSLNNIDCLATQNSLFVFNDEYIIISCEKGFALIYIKTKEFVQYIEDYINKYEKKELYLDSNNVIYIKYFYSYKEGESDNSDDDVYTIINEIEIFTVIFINFSFQIIKKYENIHPKGNLHLTCINHNNLMLWDKKVYLLE